MGSPPYSRNPAPISISIARSCPTPLCGVWLLSVSCTPLHNCICSHWWLRLPSHLRYSNLVARRLPAPSQLVTLLAIPAVGYPPMRSTCPPIRTFPPRLPPYVVIQSSAPHRSLTPPKKPTPWMLFGSARGNILVAMLLLLSRLTQRTTPGVGQEKLLVHAQSQRLEAAGVSTTIRPCSSH